MHTSLFPLPQIPLSYQNFDVLPALQQPLLSLGQFCNAGFNATLNSENVQLTKDGIAILPRTRDHRNGLYFIPLQGYSTPTHSPLPTTSNSVLYAITKSSHTPLQSYVFANIAYHMSIHTPMVQFLHQFFFSPVIDALCKAIDAVFYTTWPGLTSSLVRKHLPNPMERSKGHLRMELQHIHSTRHQPQPQPTPPPQPIHQPITTEGILFTENPPQ